MSNNRKTVLICVIIGAHLLLTASAKVPGDLFQQDIDTFHQSMAEELADQVREEMNEVPLTSSSYTHNFECTKGKNPASISRLQYIQEFAQGPCSPTVIVPGMGASKLIIKVNCQELRMNDPTAFNSCGWSSCNAGEASSPQTYYKLWLPAAGSPMSFYNPLKKTPNICFSRLLGLDVIENGDKVEVRSRPGVQVFTFGETQESTDSEFKDETCGFKSISNLLPLPESMQFGLGYFDVLRKKLEGMGFKTGVTLQALPYDWRLNYKENRLPVKFKNAIRRLYEITGKKVTIVAHSYGNLQTLHNLFEMSQEEKDRIVARYIAIGPPYLGSVKAVQSPLGLDPEFYKFGQSGITPENFKETFLKMPVIYTLMSRQIWSYFADKDWYPALIEKINAESKGISFTSKNEIIKLFPSLSEKCVLNNFKDRSSGCTTGITKYDEFGSVASEPITESNIEDILNRYSFYPLASKLYKKYTSDDRFNKLQNPGVQTNIIYASTMNTVWQLSYKKNPKTLPSDRYNNPDSYEYSLGDGTVPTTSALMAGIKWADDFNKQVSGAKPVSFVELCSEYKTRDSVFQHSSSSEEPSSNSYYGIGCQCGKNKLFKTAGGDCDHMHMITDENLVSYIANSVNKGNQGVGTLGEFKDYTEEDWKLYEARCSLFN